MEKEWFLMKANLKSLFQKLKLGFKAGFFLCYALAKKSWSVL